MLIKIDKDTKETIRLIYTRFYLRRLIGFFNVRKKQKIVRPKYLINLLIMIYFITFFTINAKNFNLI